MGIPATLARGIIATHGLVPGIDILEGSCQDMVNPGLAISGRRPFVEDKMFFRITEIYTFVEKERPFILLDLSDLDYLDIKVVRLIIEAQERFLEIGGDIRLVSPRHSVAKLMRLTKVDRVFRVFESVEDALDSWNCVERNGHFVGLRVEEG